MRLTNCVGLALCVLMAAFSPVIAGKADPQIEKEVKEYLDLSAKAYESKDVAGTMALIAPDAEVVFIDGDSEKPVVGQAAIKAAYEQEFGQIKGASIKYTSTLVGAKGDVAWFAAQCAVSVDTGEEKVTLPAHWTGVLEKRDGKWLLVQSHLSFPMPEPPQEEEPKPEAKPGEKK
ncbi:MAG: nuclear transport factor 2 family protein [Desulfomonile tiedjei]|nr:nuclear transport factor 2 family protein [Desulfomonile tiedjei]